MYFEFLTSPLATHGITGAPRISGVSFITGRPIGVDVPEPLRFPADTTAEHPPPDFTCMVVPVMSNRLVEALRAMGVDNLQCYDTILENGDTGESWRGFKAVNVIGLVSCADLEQSQYTKLGGGLYDFASLVVDPRRAQGLFFRLAEAPGTMIAHKSVGDHLYGPTTPRMSGIRFWPTDADTVAKLRQG